MTKRCTNCGKEKDIEEFPRNGNCRDGHVGYCKKCLATYWRNRWNDNRDGFRELSKKRSKEWRKNNREKENVRYRRWWSKNKDSKTWKAAMWRRYREYGRKYSKDYSEKNIIKIGKYKYNVVTVPRELKPLIETLIMLRNKKHLYKEASNGSG